jgi:hypothetical protein
MKNDKALRKHLLFLLKEEGAHQGFDAVVKDFPAELRGERPQGAAHSPWEVLEHLRIAQWDIVEFTRSSKHVSPKFPDGYWPADAAPPNGKAWDKSVAAFRADLKTMADIVADESIDLFAKIAHGDGQTVLREALVLADHNAYHLGEMVVLRRLLGAWG